jgi:alpha-glucosidase
MEPPRIGCTRILFAAAVFGVALNARADSSPTAVQSPDGRNVIVLHATGDDDGPVRFAVRRDGNPVLGPALLGPVLDADRSLGEDSRIVDVRHGKIDESFQTPWGKTSTVLNRCSYAEVTLRTGSDWRWQVELRAYDGGVACRYRLPAQDGLSDFIIRDEVTEFDPVGAPTVLFNTLGSFTTSHESLYQRQPLAAIPVGKLLEMPLLLWWPDGRAAAITEARVRDFAGAYLERTSDDGTALRCRLAPLPSRPGVRVAGETPHQSP